MNLDLFGGASAARASGPGPSAAAPEKDRLAPAILSAATALAPNVVEQESIASLLKGLWGEKYEQSRRWRSTVRGSCSRRPATCLRPRCCSCCAISSRRARRGRASME